MPRKKTSKKKATRKKATRKKAPSERDIQIKIALDEIEAAQAILNKKRITQNQKKEAGIWLRRNKQVLKDLKYKGQMPRQRRTVGQVVVEAKKDEEE